MFDWWPLSIGRTGLLFFVIIVLALMIASSSSSNDSATKASVAAPSTAETGTDDPTKRQQVNIALTLPKDYTTTRIMQTFQTAKNSVANLNTFVPLMCNMTMCNYTGWLAGAAFTGNDFDVLGDGGDNWVDMVGGSAANNMNWVRLECAWSAFQPLLTAGVATLSVRVVLPTILLNTAKSPATSLFNLRFSFGTRAFEIVADTALFETTIQIQMATGTISQFPFDTYSKTFPLYLTIADPVMNFGQYTKAAPEPQFLMSVARIPLSFMLKIDYADSGMFSHKDVIVQAPPATADNKAPAAMWTVTFQRPPISIVFPAFIFFAFWIIAIFDVIFYLPFIGTTKKLDAAPAVGLSASLLFALPGIRNAMPGNVPIGSVFDFGSYYWALLIAVFCFAFATSRWCADVHPAPPAPAPAAEVKK
jgi:hypothetical protein